MGLKRCTCGLWRALHTVLPEERPFPFSPKDLLGPLLPHFVPRAGHHQTRSLPAWWGEGSLHSIDSVGIPIREVGISDVYWHVQCLSLEGFALCPLRKHRPSTVFWTKGCDIFLWPWVVRNAFQLGISLSSFLHFSPFCLGHRKSQPFPDCLLALGSHLV